MTDREKAIVMAYTGYCMLAGDKLSVFYEYVESIMRRPVYTHEMVTKVVDNLIKEKARPDFIALCADESSSENPNKWIPVSERLPKYSTDVLTCNNGGYIEIKSIEGIDSYWENQNGDLSDFDAVVAWMPLPEPYKVESEG